MPIQITMPALSPTMTDGTLAKWLKKEGDVIAPGDVIAEIETDKATMEVEAVDEGTLAKIIVADGTTNVAVNKVIALLLEDGEDASALDNFEIKEDTPAAEEAPASASAPATENAPAAAPAPTQATAAPVAAPSKAPVAAKSTQITVPSSIKASPVAKRVAAEMGVNLATIRGTGPKGRIVKADVEEAALRGGTGGAVSRNPQAFTTVPNTSMRQTIARRLQESKQQVPHFYLTAHCRLDALLQARAQINEKATREAGEGEKPAYKVSVNDMIIKASALALKEIPEANASWYDDATVQYGNVDISVAVAIEGGLITPIVKNADQKSLPQISVEMKELAKRARAGALQPEEYQGGGFSISNLGMYGTSQFSAIVNPPQAAILAVGAGETRAMVQEDGSIAPETVMTVTLSCDHRVIDGAVGAELLAAFKRNIEQPILMLV